MKMIEEAVMPTDYGNFIFKAYSESIDNYSPDLALVSEGLDLNNDIPLVRLHSECLTGDIFHSMRCDCGNQLSSALKMISEHGGVLIYLRQEGRGIGLINKLRAYKLQDTGQDTYEANLHLGFQDDGRDYSNALYILEDLNIRKLKLLTNNPSKILALEKANIQITERIPLIIPPNTINQKYLNDKMNKKGHFL